jgi:hypothetical protein
MKKSWSFLASAALTILAAGYGVAGPAPGTGIVGSWHDINSSAGYAGSPDGKVCIFCHTSADTTPSEPGEWNHVPSVLPPMPPYQWQEQANVAIPIASDPLVGSSRHCMDCHDGATAVDAYVNENPMGLTYMTAAYRTPNGGTASRYITDLQEMHPIGFMLDDAVTQSSWNLKPGLSADSTFAGNAAVSVGARLRLDAGFMTCSTCHDVHNELDSVATSGYQLIGGPKKIDLCLTCHTHVDNPYAHNRSAWAGGTPVTGACGTSNGATFTTAPTTNLCASAANTPIVSGTGPWTWTCNGVYGGTDATCSANLPAVNGSCGAAGGGTFSAVPTDGLCATGTATPVAGSGPWNWTCTGSSGGTTAACTAAALTTTATPPVGSYSGGTLLVTLSASAPANIYYTIDGSTPTTSSSVYSAPISISGNLTLKYFAKTATATEAVKTSTYAVTPSGPPSASLSATKTGTTYTVLRSQDGSTYTPVVTNTTSTSFSDTSTLQSNTTYQYAVTSDTDPTQTQLMTIHTPLYQGWNVLGVPYASQGIAPSAFFGSAVSEIYQWIPTGATPETSDSQLGYYVTVNGFTSGNGYFVKANNSNTMVVTAGSPGPASINVTLKPGWTMVSSPNTTTKKNIGANWLIDGHALSQSVIGNQIGGGVYWWNGTTYDSWTIMGDNPTIEPWKGYWIVNLDSVNHTLTIK